MGVFERHRYPDNWKALAQACKEEAGWCCARCGARHGEKRIGSVHERLYTVVVAACHVHHDPENPHPVLIALCQACHLRHDGWQHSRARKRNEGNARRASERDAGQQDLPWDRA